MNHVACAMSEFLTPPPPQHTHFPQSVFVISLQWVELSKAKAKCINPDLPVYDVLLDTYEKGMTSARINEVFSKVRVTGPVPVGMMPSDGQDSDHSGAGIWIIDLMSKHTLNVRA